MYKDPYLGIKKPLIVFKDTKKISDNSYVSIDLYELNRMNYYEVVYHNNDKEIFFGKYYKTDSLLNVAYKDGKILVYTTDYNRDTYKMEIVEVLVLYNIEDDLFYYYTEQDAIKAFDDSLATSNLKNKDRKILLTHIKKRMKCPVSTYNSRKNKKEFGCLNVSSIESNNNADDLELDKQKTKIIKLPK